MKRHHLAILVIVGFSVYACTSSMPGTQSPVGAAITPPITAEYVPTVLPITPTYEGCAYVWGSQDLPNLSRIFNAELQKIGPEAGGLAYAYGENCLYADGHSTFGAMETDFRVGVQVTSIKDEAALGDWIDKIMRVVVGLPPDELMGPQAGRVDFDFKQPDPAELFVTVPIDKYRSEAAGLRGAQLFRLFYQTP
jgi:hypothetical protein